MLNAFSLGSGEHSSRVGEGRFLEFRRVVDSYAGLQSESEKHVPVPGTL